jgi:hypothetical protein
MTVKKNNNKTVKV